MVLRYFEDNSMFITHLRVNYKLCSIAKSAAVTGF